MTGCGRARGAATLLAIVTLAVPAPSGAERPGVPPVTPWACPSTHPIKGYAQQSGRRVYYFPGSPFYEEASPERCYATEDEARHDGSRPAREDGIPCPEVACAPRVHGPPRHYRTGPGLDAGPPAG